MPGEVGIDGPQPEMQTTILKRSMSALIARQVPVLLYLSAYGQAMIHYRGELMNAAEQYGLAACCMLAQSDTQKGTIAVSRTDAWLPRLHHRVCCDKYGIS